MGGKKWSSKGRHFFLLKSSTSGICPSPGFFHERASRNDMTYLWALKDGLPAHADQAVRPLPLQGAAEPGRGGGRAQGPAALQVQILPQPLPAAAHVLLGTRHHLREKAGGERGKWGKRGKESSRLKKLFNTETLPKKGGTALQNSSCSCPCSWSGLDTWKAQPGFLSELHCKMYCCPNTNYFLQMPCYYKRASVGIA